MKNLPKGTLTKITEITGISGPNLSEYISGGRFPSRSRAIELEQACISLGLKVSKETWMFGTVHEIKSALLNSEEKLRELIGDYWDAAYKAGMEKRTHDTEDGTEGKILSEINKIINQFIK